MHIKKISIKNIKSIADLEMNFNDNEMSGWHVILGENSSGKSSIVKAITMCLIGPQLSNKLPTMDWKSWLYNYDSTLVNFSSIDLVVGNKDVIHDNEVKTINSSIAISEYKNDAIVINRHLAPDQLESNIKNNLEEYLKKYVEKSVNNIKIKYSDSNEKPTRKSLEKDLKKILNASVLENVILEDVKLGVKEQNNNQAMLLSNLYSNEDNNGWFSMSFGPYRRFNGGDPEWGSIGFGNQKLAAHITAFGEDFAISEPINWLIKLDHQIKESNEDAKKIKDLIFNFINETNLLPLDIKIKEINSDGVFFIDNNSNTIHINNLSDGIRSVLSLTLEMVRQLIRSYGIEAVIENWKNIDNKFSFDLDGVIIIDEIDLHLHPSWQTEIGKWFINVFPNIQFIVTTHSPLICRACTQKSKVWKLNSSSSSSINEITEIEKEKLISGNILDAYGTELFGSSPVNFKANINKKQELGRLKAKKAIVGLNEDEKNQLLKLEKVLSTDAAN